MKKKIITFLLCSFSACTQKKEIDLTSKTSTDFDTFTVMRAPGAGRKKMTPRELNSPEMLPPLPAVTMKSFFTSDAPVITFEKPASADWVQVLRCKSSVSLCSNLKRGLCLKNIHMKTLSPAEKSSFFTGTDIFAKAGEKECIQLGEGSKSSEFTDFSASSGTYYWLLRSCVHSTRLLSVSGALSGNCSPQVQRTKDIKYFNKRESKKQKALAAYLERINLIRADIEAIRVIGLRWIDAYTKKDVGCFDIETNREKATKFKQALVTMVAIGMEVALELYGAKFMAKQDCKKCSAMSMYDPRKKGMGSLLEWGQMFQAAGGQNFAEAFVRMSTDAEDIPRTCWSADKLQSEIRLKENDLARHIGESIFYLNLSNLYHTQKSFHQGLEPKEGFLPTLTDETREYLRSQGN